jgi:hypothetical protein
VNPALLEALTFVRQAADSAITGIEAKLPQLTEDGLVHLENVVAPIFHVPPNIVLLARTQNASIEAVVDPLEKSALELLRDRIDGLPSTPSAPAASGTGNAPPSPAPAT